MAKSIIDYISEEDYKRFEELLAIAETNKANAPKPERKPRGPLTFEQKKKMTEAKLLKAQAALDALLAAEAE